MKFIHTADIHFGMENYGRIDLRTGVHTRLLDFEKALNFIIDTAISEQVDFFLFSGDAYKTATPSPTQQKLLMSCLFRLYKAGIPVVIVIGNHDHPLSFGKATSLDVFGNLPLEGFHVFSKPSKLVLDTKSGPVQIVGIPWPSRTNIALNQQNHTTATADISSYLSQAVGSIIKQLAAELDPAIPSVLAGHLTVSSGIFSGSERRAIYGTDPLFLPSELAIEPFDYVALGHLHRYQDLNPNGYPAIIYSGSPERVDFGERNEEKGFCLVDLVRKETTHVFIKTPVRPFMQFDIHLDPHQDQTEQIIRAIETKNIQDAIIKIVYHLPVDGKDDVDLKKIQRYCQEAMFLVGIIPVRPIQTRKARASLQGTTGDIGTLLADYFENKPELRAKKEQLLSKAAALKEQMELARRDDKADYDE